MNKMKHINNLDTEKDSAQSITQALTEKQINTVYARFGEAKTLLTTTKLLAIIKHIPIGKLKYIHPNIELARELCLIMLSYFIREWIEHRNGETYKTQLYSKILEKTFKIGRDEGVYKRVLNVLEEGTSKKGSIILKHRNYYAGQGEGSSNEYKLALPYYKGSIKEYTLNSAQSKRIHNRYRKRLIKDALKNPIAVNELLNTYQNLEWPTVEEVRTYLKQKSKEGYYNKKGKKLKVLGKNKIGSKGYEQENYIFVEQYIDNYIFWTHPSLVVPIVLDYKSGGRVVTSFNMIPAVIRNMITTKDGEPLKEYDLSCLHPNLAMKIYGSNIRITHERVAGYLGIERREAKLLHLKFFNQHINDMQDNPLWDYYEANMEADAFKRMIDEKAKGQKILTYQLFKLETNIMQDWIERCDEEGINCYYVYDCLYTEEVPEGDEDIMQDIMQEIMIEHDITPF